MHGAHTYAHNAKEYGHTHTQSTRIPLTLHTPIHPLAHMLPHHAYAHAFTQLTCTNTRALIHTHTQVIDIGRMKDGDYKYVQDDIAGVAQLQIHT